MSKLSKTVEQLLARDPREGLTGMEMARALEEARASGSLPAHLSIDDILDCKDFLELSNATGMSICDFWTGGIRRVERHARAEQAVGSAAQQQHSKQSSW